MVYTKIQNKFCKRYKKKLLQNVCEQLESVLY